MLASSILNIDRLASIPYIHNTLAPLMLPLLRFVLARYVNVATVYIVIKMLRFCHE